eukprot:6988326-Pyramimonas_sp.AAC.1
MAARRVGLPSASSAFVPTTCCWRPRLVHSCLSGQFLGAWRRKGDLLLNAEHFAQCTCIARLA